MATITARKRAGGVRYTAQIRIHRKGQVVYSESKTFGKKALAKEWARRRELELDEPGALARLQHRGVTVGDLIERYIADREQVDELGRSKKAHLRQMLAMDLARLDALELTAQQIIQHARSRRLAGTGGATVNNDLIWLRVVLRYARTALGVPVDRHVVDDASDACWSERLLARTKRRDRRPSAADLRSLADFWARPTGRPTAIKASLYLVMWFAIYTSRRLDEICRLRLADMDRAHGVWMVRDVKNPGGSKGNDLEMRVPDRAWPVIDALIRLVSDGERLVPIKSKTIGTYFARAVILCGIEDLRFHDLRHEACSRLAEDGESIPRIQQVSLHESWSSLQRYVNLRTRAEDRVEFDPAHPSLALLADLRGS